jgi:hypothetical protein
MTSCRYRNVGIAVGESADTPGEVVLDEDAPRPNHDHLASVPAWRRGEPHGRGPGRLYGIWQAFGAAASVLRAAPCGRICTAMVSTVSVVLGLRSMWT